MQRILLVFGIVLVVAGLLWPWLGKLPLGRLPGDIAIDRGNFSLRFPLATSLLVSALLTLLVWLLRR